MSKYLPLNLFIRQALLYPLTSPFLPPENKVLTGYSFAAGRKTGSYVCPPQGLLLKTGQTTKYADGDDGDHQKGLTKSYTYSQVNGIDTEAENVLLDDHTELEWIRDHKLLNGSEVGAGGNQIFNTVMNWATALTRCNALTYDGKSDWRLPNAYEILSIIELEHDIGTPYIDLTAFPNTHSGQYWSSTTYAYGADWANDIHFNLGLLYYTIKTGTLWVRPVRGPD